MKKIVICGGHLTPALALIEELQKKKGLEIIFFGRKFATEGSNQLSQEYKIINQRKIKFYPITAGKLQRKFTRFTIPSLLKLPLGSSQALRYLIKEKPDLVVSFGSYVSTPVVVAAFLLGIKSIAHEQSISPGLATKINSKFTKKIFLTWKESEKFFKKGKSKLIGNLTRKSIFAKKAKNKTLANFIKKEGKLLFVAGGNQGSHFINSLIFNSLDQFKGYLIVHQVGSTNFAGDLDKAKGIKKPDYLPVEFLDGDNFGAMLSRCDILIGRSGINTVWDCLQTRAPAIYIPLSGEQTENALYAQKEGVAKVIYQNEATPGLLKKTIDEIFTEYANIKKSLEKTARNLPKNGAYIMAAEARKLLND